MKPEIRSVVNKSHISTREVVHVGKFKCLTDKMDGVIKKQRWLPIKGSFCDIFTGAYHPKNMTFLYFEDISFLESKDLTKEHHVYRRSSFISDWSEFKGLNHLLCDYRGFDGNFYKISRKTPLPFWRYYVFCGRYYDLEKLERLLSRKKWAEGIVHDHGNRKLSFYYFLPNSIEYKLSSREITRTLLHREICQ